MTYLFGHKVPRKIQKALGVKQTSRFDEATRQAVQARWGGSGKKLDAIKVSVLLNDQG